MTAPSLSPDTVRNLVLHSQGLSHPPSAAADKMSVVKTIHTLGALQIDTINIVARAPYFSLFSRLGNYDPLWLDEALNEKQIFEYWAHAASFLPIDHYPFHRRLMIEKMRHPQYHCWYAKNQTACDAVLEYVRKNGQVRSADFERQDGRKGSWWDWKFEKDALEYWFCAGELMIARREKFQRVYDLRERIQPDWNDANAPSLKETLRFFVIETIRALGIARPEWVADYFRLLKTPVNQILQELLNDHTIIQLSVSGWDEPVLSLPETLPLLDNDLTPTLTTLLSPFDSLIWDRKRTKQLFGFDFSIECYLPPTKRKYGYFLLPVLHRGNLVGRLDAKAHRKEGIFEIIGLFWEPNICANQDLLLEVGQAIQRCANWHGTPTVLIRKTVPDEMAPNLL